MSQDKMVYLGLCMKLDPPLIGICYKDREKDEKKKVYQILLQRLVLNPNVQEVVEQLYQEHPHILKQNKIPKERIAALFQRIQLQLEHPDNDDEDEEYQEEEQLPIEKGQAKPQRRNYQFDDDDEPNHKLNRSNRSN